LTEPAPTVTYAAAGILAGAETPATVPAGDFEALSNEVARLQVKSMVLDLLPDFEDRINTIEQKVHGLVGLGARVDAIESRLDGMEVDVENARMAAARPYVEMPLFEGMFEGVKLYVRRSAFLNIGLSIIALLLIIGLIVMLVIRNKKVAEHNKTLIKQYIKNYTKAGYKLKTLEMHLEASGWQDKEIQEALKELGLK
jgi:hypothetical protein